MITLITIAVCIVGFVYFGVPWIYGRWSRILLRHKAEKAKGLALTFDDGPGTVLTTCILEILEEHHAKATFFLLGRNISGREQIVREIAKQGHEVCSHGYDHLHHWKVGPVRAIKDIKCGWKAIDNVLGVNSGKYPYRPPYGKLNLASLLYLLLLRVPILYWTFDLGDTGLLDGQDIPKNSLISRNTGGDVILAHDFDRPDRSIDPFVLKAVKSAMTLAEDNQLRVLTVSELLKAD